jgi:hypothetical protein
MGIVTGITTVLLIGAALALAILRIREQNRLKAATRNLVQSYSEFDDVLDKIEKLVLNIEHNKPVSYTRVYVSFPAHKLYISEVRRLNKLCKYHGLPHTSSIEYAQFMEESAMSEQPWRSEDETEYEQSLAWHSGALLH